MIIAFCFGALLEALAGFGTPVAITAAMLIALGFQPIKAASVALVANTAPVAFGAIAIPIITLAEITGLPKDDLGAMVGRQTPLLALFVPLVLVGMVDGMRGVRQAWPAALVGGLVFAIAQFACSNYVSVELTDIVASLLSTGAIVGAAAGLAAERAAARRARQRRRPAIAGAATFRPGARGRGARASDDHADTRGEIFAAYAPYLIIIVVLSLAQWGPIKDWLDGADEVVRLARPGHHQRRRRGARGRDVQVQLVPTPPGTLLLVAGLLTMAVLRVSPGRALRVYGRTLNQLKWATLTVATVLALAYVMNFSGQTLTLGLWIAGAGGLLAFLSPIIGWLGVAVTGSDTCSNSLFGALQVSAAKEAGLDQTLLAAAELLRRRARQDGLAAEPRHRRRRRRPARPGGRSLPSRDWMEPAVAPDHVRARLPAVDGGALVDGGARGRSRRAGEPAPARLVELRDRGAEWCYTQEHQLRTYESDGLLQYQALPAVAVLPGSAEEVQACVRACAEAGVPWVARGAGSGLSRRRAAGRRRRAHRALAA